MFKLQTAELCKHTVKVSLPVSQVTAGC